MKTVSNIRNPVVAESISEIESSQREYYNYPQSKATEAVQRLLLSAGDLDRLEHNDVQHGSAVRTIVKDKLGGFRVTRGETEIDITIDDIDLLRDGAKPARKLFDFLLIYINQHGISGGTLTRNAFHIPIKELQTAGLYGTQRAARAGIDAALPVLSALKISGKMYSKGKNGARSINPDAAGVSSLFPNIYRLKDGHIFIELNSRLNWGIILAYYTILPAYVFKLKGNAPDLLRYIFYVARQNTDKIEEGKPFTLSLRAVQRYLCLPDENNTKNPSRDIRERIETAIGEIEDAEAAAAGSNAARVTITPVYKDDCSIYEYLENGYLSISISGEYAKPIARVSQNQRKAIEKNNKRQERIEAAARAKKKAADM